MGYSVPLFSNAFSWVIIKNWRVGPKNNIKCFVKHFVFVALQMSIGTLFYKAKTNHGLLWTICQRIYKIIIKVNGGSMWEDKEGLKG